MPKTYPEPMTMTERAILDELSAIAALPSEEMTLEDAHRAHHLKGCLVVIDRTRQPAGSRDVRPQTAEFQCDVCTACGPHGNPCPFEHFPQGHFVRPRN
jgi:hypothetical protein